MALRFHARRKIPQRFFPPSHIHPARCRAKAALLNSSSTPSKELASHVISMVSRAPTQRAKSEFSPQSQKLRASSGEQFSILSKQLLNRIRSCTLQTTKTLLYKRVTKGGVLFQSCYLFTYTRFHFVLSDNEPDQVTEEENHFSLIESFNTTTENHRST